jgi:hypothetical protein
VAQGIARAIKIHLKKTRDIPELTSTEKSMEKFTFQWRVVGCSKREGEIAI